MPIDGLNLYQNLKTHTLFPHPGLLGDKQQFTVSVWKEKKQDGLGGKVKHLAKRVPIFGTREYQFNTQDSERCL